MRKLISRIFLFVALLSVIFISVSFMQSSSSEKEVLLVETYITGGLSYGVSIFHNDKPTEFIEMDFKSIIEEGKGEGEMVRKMVEEKGKIIRNTLQMLYNDGWKLEGTIGGDSSSKFILTK